MHNDRQKLPNNLQSNILFQENSDTSSPQFGSGESLDQWNLNETVTLHRNDEKGDERSVILAFLPPRSHGASSPLPLIYASTSSGPPCGDRCPSGSRVEATAVKGHLRCHICHQPTVGTVYPPHLLRYVRSEGVAVAAVTAASQPAVCHSVRSTSVVVVAVAVRRRLSWPHLFSRRTNAGRRL